MTERIIVQPSNVQPSLHARPASPTKMLSSVSSSSPLSIRISTDHPDIQLDNPEPLATHLVVDASLASIGMELPPSSSSDSGNSMDTQSFLAAAEENVGPPMIHNFDGSDDTLGNELYHWTEEQMARERFSGQWDVRFSGSPLHRARELVWGSLRHMLDFPQMAADNLRDLNRNLSTYSAIFDDSSSDSRSEPDILYNDVADTTLPTPPEPHGRMSLEKRGNREIVGARVLNDLENAFRRIYLTPSSSEISQAFVTGSSRADDVLRAFLSERRVTFVTGGLNFFAKITGFSPVMQLRMCSPPVNVLSILSSSTSSTPAFESFFLCFDANNILISPGSLTTCSESSSSITMPSATFLTLASSTPSPPYLPRLMGLLDGPPILSPVRPMRSQVLLESMLRLQRERLRLYRQQRLTKEPQPRPPATQHLTNQPMTTSMAGLVPPAASSSADPLGTAPLTRLERFASSIRSLLGWLAPFNFDPDIE
ncbi:hypothetical protein C8F04DRAFT_601714 [Mycena alexandri]|uniref:Uncharacterized protein n=1 Tax=Mycena alexandri TaxID=1745969 RepID=A0AAD6SU22_9AGAR|nr:hypothetical protein C8F04DRAFT_601714 [Mycena alexandri]